MRNPRRRRILRTRGRAGQRLQRSGDRGRWP